ncbi:unnamed protein product, partial [Symbiodinium sp. CCMP2456]
MGRKDQWKSRRPDAGYDGWGHSSSSWQGPGAGKTWNQREGRWQQEGSAKPLFPSFEEMKINERQPRDGAARREQPDEQHQVDANDKDGYITGVQKALNVVRKAEGRTRKLTTDRKATEAKWAEFQASLREAYITERAKYKEKMAKITQDEEDNAVAKNEALAELKEIMTQPKRAPEKREKSAEDAEALAELEALLRKPSEAEGGGITEILAAAVNDGDLDNHDKRQKILRAIEDHRRGEDEIKTPERRRRATIERTPPAKKQKEEATELPYDSKDHPEDVKMAEPYIASPALRSMPGLAAESSRSKSRSRMPIKFVGRAPARQDRAKAISARLEAKRNMGNEEEQDAESVGESEDEDDETLAGLVRGRGGRNAGDGTDETQGGLEGSWYYEPDGYEGTGATQFYQADAPSWPFRPVQDHATDRRLPQRHGPPGGHDRGPHVMDIFDVQEIIMETILDYTQKIQFEDEGRTAEIARAGLLTVQAMALLSPMVALAIYARRRTLGDYKMQRRGSRPSWLRILLVASLWRPTAAMPRASMRASQTPWPSCPRQSDLELWASGQLTLREQFANAEMRAAAEAPLHSGGRFEAAAPRRHPAERGEQLPAELETEEWNWIDEEAERTTHISFWVCAPLYEPVSLDIALEFPMTQQRMYEAIEDSILDLPTGVLDRVIAVTPQVDEHYGSVMLIPSWVTMSGRWAIVIDARNFQCGIFGHYVDGPISERAILRAAGMERGGPTQVFAFGSLTPLGPEDTVPPQQG